MKIAICYSGQLRLSRFLHKLHINHLFRKLSGDDHELHLFFYTDNINTSRCRENGNINWKINKDENITNKIHQLFNYYSKFCKTSRLEITESQVTDPTQNKESSSKLNLYYQNLNSQLNKFINVLNLAQNAIIETSSQYDIVIRLRPDIFFTSDVSTEFLNTIKNTSKFVQNMEVANRYKGDVIQIFDGKYLQKIIEISRQYLNYEKGGIRIYEDCINRIAIESGLNLEYIGNMCGRWYDCYATYYPGLCWIYFKDWENIEYKNHFNMELLKNITSRKLEITKTSLSDDEKLLFNISEPHVKLYCAAMQFDYIDMQKLSTSRRNLVESCEIDFAGLIPCAGTASRMGGLPKFLLPCENGTLLNNTICHYRNHFISKIYIGFSQNNMQYFNLLDNEYSDLVPIDVNSTATMSETVIKMTLQLNTAKNYILFMPDTFFRLDRELVQMMALFNANDTNNTNKAKFDVVVIVWKIRPEQYGKLGQCLIENGEVIDIKDKDPNCRYEYSWGVIGWSQSMTQYIDPVTPHVGFLINAALENNKKVGAVISNSVYYDCGTYNEYFQMIKNEI